MTKKLQYQNHPSNPAAQPFNGKGSRNKTKVHSWWNPSSGTYYGNRKKEKKSDE